MYFLCLQAGGRITPGGAYQWSGGGGGLKAVVYGAVERRNTAKILHKTRTFGISLPSITGRGSNHVFM